jgi:hypothetical protein
MLSHLQAWHDFERIQKGRPEASVATYLRQVESFLAWLEGEGRLTVPGPQGLLLRRRGGQDQGHHGRLDVHGLHDP